MFKLLLISLLAISPGCTRSACTLQKIKRGDDVKVEVPVAVKWKEDPVILVCDTAPVTKDEVAMLLDEWAAHGAPKLEVVNSKCVGEPMPGYIQIDQWRPEWRLQVTGAYAVTAVWPEDPVMGLIMVPDGNLSVLRHELGHIWIHGHTPVMGHVVCPYVECTGDDWEGVKKAFKRGGY